MPATERTAIAASAAAAAAQLRAAAVADRPRVLGPDTPFAAAMRAYVKSVLDAGYAASSAVADARFPKGVEDTRPLVAMYSDALCVCSALCGAEVPLRAVLGAELASLLLWGRGSLAYMCACTIEGDAARSAETAAPDYSAVSTSGALVLCVSAACPCAHAAGRCYGLEWRTCA